MTKFIALCILCNVAFAEPTVIVSPKGNITICTTVDNVVICS